jgi:hypothetical protein
MHARLDCGPVKLLTRTEPDGTHKYPPIAKAVASLGARHLAYRNWELPAQPQRHRFRPRPGNFWVLEAIFSGSDVIAAEVQKVVDLIVG